MHAPLQKKAESLVALQVQRKTSPGLERDFSGQASVQRKRERRLAASALQRKLAQRAEELEDELRPGKFATTLAGDSAHERDDTMALRVGSEQPAKPTLLQGKFTTRQLAGPSGHPDVGERAWRPKVPSNHLVVQCRAIGVGTGEVAEGTADDVFFTDNLFNCIAYGARSGQTGSKKAVFVHANTAGDVTGTLSEEATKRLGGAPEWCGIGYGALWRNFLSTKTGTWIRASLVTKLQPQWQGFVGTSARWPVAEDSMVGTATEQPRQNDWPLSGSQIADANNDWFALLQSAYDPKIGHRTLPGGAPATVEELGSPYDNTPSWQLDDDQ